jgi:hypothetical protein
MVALFCGRACQPVAQPVFLTERVQQVPKEVNGGDSFTWQLGRKEMHALAGTGADKERPLVYSPLRTL